MGAAQGSGMRTNFLGLLVLQTSLAALTAGCTGFSLGENEPDNNLGTYLGDGAVAVDPDNETTYVLLSEEIYDEEDGSALETERTLFAVRAGATEAEAVADLSGRDDPRLLFTSNGVLAMSQQDDSEELLLLDRETFEQKARTTVPTWYYGTRLSASRRWVGVADNDSSDYDIHVIDSETLDTRVIPHGGDLLEAMFLNQSDRLAAISLDDASHEARLLVWDMNLLAATEFMQLPGSEVWAGAVIDVVVPDVEWDSWFSFTWVGISPDDRLAVFPVKKWDGEYEIGDSDPDDYQLIVLDLETRQTTIIPRAKGPIGFTPDGSSIVSYDETADGEQRLLLIDALTLEPDPEPIDVAIDGSISYFVSHEGNYVVVASSDGEQSLVLYDIDNKKETKMAGPGVGLTEFVSRSDPEELWVVQRDSYGGDLYRVDLQGAEVEEISVPFSPEHIGILPKRDELVLTDFGRTTLHFMDPTTEKVLREVELPVGQK
jgi:dipeptidyl aminopeptidase/acylaminoacyl peptidase